MPDTIHNTFLSRRRFFRRAKGSTLLPESSTVHFQALFFRNLIPVMKKTSQRKRSPNTRNPIHITSNLASTFPGRSAPSRRGSTGYVSARSLFFPNTAGSRTCIPRTIPHTVRKARITGFLALPVFLLFQAQKAEAPLRKKHREMHTHPGSSISRKTCYRYPPRFPENIPLFPVLHSKS